jgi:hypothetical protein
MESNAKVAVATQEGVRKEETFHPIVISRLYVSPYQKEGTRTVELKQTVGTKTFYPSKTVTSNLQDNPFNTEDFGFEETEYETDSVRVAWVDVPVKLSDAVVIARLKSITAARLYRILSNHPILSDRQEYTIENPIAGADITLTLESIADRQAIRYPKNHATDAGLLIMDGNGKPQYKAIFFSKTAKEDIDRRNEIADDFYSTSAMREEMTGVISQSMTSL